MEENKYIKSFFMRIVRRAANFDIDEKISGVLTWCERFEQQVYVMEGSVFLDCIRVS